MFDEARSAISNSSLDSTVYIGADSIRLKNKKGEWVARYSVVIILHKASKHGCKIFQQKYEERDFGNLRQRLISEAGYAIQAALEVIDAIGERKFEIHLDINPNPVYKSNSAVKEALGYVRGMTGVEAKIKPFAFAATNAADHIVRNPGDYM
jgi:predicted RNase H-related nuclease YkuK (DUF458 family)